MDEFTKGIVDGTKETLGRITYELKDAFRFLNKNKYDVGKDIGTVLTGFGIIIIMVVIAINIFT